MLISTLFEFLLTIVGSTLFAPILQPAVPELLHKTLGEAFKPVMEQ